ncbi:MAG TPA: Ig-like domain-containing protein, partial [Kofleriaceae bacterium]|nr:Ig-like domain-containing protein [Kofleriaceae bacterium]
MSSPYRLYSALVFASFLFAAQRSDAHTITVDPVAYQGVYQVDGGAQKTSTATFDLAAGTHTVSVVSSTFTFVVDAAGQVSSSQNPAQALGSTLRFKNVTINVDPAAYDGRYFLRSQFSQQFVGPHSFVVLPSLTYDMSNIVSLWSFSVDALGNVLCSHAASTCSGNTLRFNTTAITVAPGAYTGRYFLRSHFTEQFTGSHTFIVIRGLEEHFSNVTDLLPFNVDATGNVVISSPAATGAGSTLSLNTTTMTVDPGQYTGLYFIRSYFTQNVSGVRTFAVIPGLLHEFSNISGLVGFRVDASGNIVISSPSAVGIGSTLKLNNTTITVDPGAYTGRYYVRSYFTTQFSGQHSYVVVPGMQHELSNITDLASFNVTGTGTITSTHPAITGSGSTLKVNTTSITATPSDPNVNYSLQSYPGVTFRGPHDFIVMLGSAHSVVANGQLAQFRVGSPCSVTPSSVIAPPTSFALACTPTPPADSTPPVVRIDATPALAASADLVVTGNVRDNVGVASAAFIVNGVRGPDLGIAPGGDVSATLHLSEGANTIVLQATDAAGNPASTSAVIVVDTTAPAISIESPAADQAVSTQSLSVVVTVGDASPTTVTIDGTVYRLDSSGTIVATVDLGGDGYHDVVVSALDAAGNSSSRAVRVLLDTTAPLVEADVDNGTVFGPLPDHLLPVTFRVDSMTATTVTLLSGDVYELARGGGLIHALVPLSEGVTTFAISAVDEAGRTSTLSGTVVYDTTAPRILDLSPTGGQSVRGVVEIGESIADDTSGVAAVLVTVDGIMVGTVRDGSVWNGSFDTTTLADGTHTIDVFATDVAGNGSVSSRTFTVDNTAPIATIRAPLAGALVRGTISIDVEASDTTSGLGGVDVVVDGTSLGACSQSPCRVAFDTTTLPDGPFAISASATDRAGNRSVVASITAIADNSAPSDFLVSPRSGDIVADSFTLQLAIHDASFASVQCTLDGATIATSTNPAFTTTVTTTGLLDGDSVVRCVATDGAGNVGVSSATITIARWTARISPTTLNLRSKGGATSVTAVIEGRGTQSLTGVTVAVPGGSPVAATPIAVGDDDHDGIPDVVLKIDRQALIASSRGALAANAIQAGVPFNV